MPEPEPNAVESNAALLPAELRRMVPRPVRLTAAGKAVAVLALLLAAGAVAAGIGLYLAAERDRSRLEEIRREAVTAEAEIIAITRRRGRQDQVTVIYQYAAGGRTYRGGARLRRREAARLRVGERLAIGYLPSAPERSWRLGREPAGVPLWTAPAVPAGLGLSAAALLLVLRGRRRLLAEGRAAPARVIRTEKLGGKQRLHRVHYEFTLPSGARRSGRFDVSGAPPEPGAWLVILYDPDEPRRQGRYPFSLVRVARPQES